MRPHTPRTCVIHFILLTLLLSPLRARADEDGPRQPTELWPVFRYQDREDVEELRVLWPIFESYEDAERERWALRPLLAWESSKRSGDGSFDLLWPLIGASTGGAGRHDRALPFYWRDATPSTRRLITPLSVYERDDATDSAFLLALPNIFYERHGEARSWHIWPLIGHSQDGLRRRRWSTLAPLFGLESEAGVGITELDLLWPLAGYRRDPLTDASTSWSPLHYAARDPERSFTVLGPALWSDDGARSGFGLLPLGYIARGEASTDVYTPLGAAWGQGSGRTIVTPLYAGAGDSERGWSLWMGLGFARWRGPRTERVYGPFLRVDDDESGWQALLPLAGQWWEEGGDGGWAALPGLARWRRGAASTTIIGPYAQHTTPNDSWRLLAPLLASWEGEDGSGELVAPAYAHWVRGEDEGRVVGPWVSVSEDAGARGWGMLLPVGWWSWSPASRARVFGPLIASESARMQQLHVLPLSYSARGPGWRWSLLLPFGFDGEWGERWAQSWGPLIQRGGSPSSSWLLVHPLYYDSADASGGVRAVLPLYAGGWSAGGCWGATPLGGWWSNGGGAGQVLGPWLAQASEDGGSGWRALLPLFAQGWSGDDGWLWVTPALYRGESGGERTLVAGPYAEHSSENGERGWWTLAGLASRWWTAEARGWAALPLYAEQRGADSGWFASLPASASWSEEGWDAYLLGVLGHASSRERSTDWLAPLYWSWRRPGARTRLLLPLGYDSETEEERDLWIWPLLRYEREGDGGRAVSTLWPLIGGELGPDRAAWHLRPLASWRRSGETQAWSLLWPLFERRSGPDSSAAHVLYGLAHHEREGAVAQTRVLWRLYAYDADEESASTQLLYGLYERSAEPERSFWALRPLVSLERWTSGAGGAELRLLSGALSYGWRGEGGGGLRLFGLQVGG